MAYYRRSNDFLDEDLAYGDLPPNRWDRDRFERARYEERDRFERAPVREREVREVIVEDRPRGRYEDRVYFDDISPPPRFASRVRREIYDERIGEVERDRALLPYRRRDEFERERERDVVIDIERGPRPGLIRRQSSLDTFDRRGGRFVRELEVVRRPSPPRGAFVEEEIKIKEREREGPLGEVRDVEITREREVIKTGDRGRARSIISEARSGLRSASSSSSSTSIVAERLIGRKGHTKLPKPQFRRFAIERFGVAFTEEDDRFILHRALDKTMIDQILLWSREGREGRVTTYNFDGDRLVNGNRNDHYEAIRTEWINPPSVRGISPARSSRTVIINNSPPPVPVVPVAAPVVEEVKVKVEEKVAAPVGVLPPPVPQVLVPPPIPQAYYPPPMPMPMPMTVAVANRVERSHHDISEEIRRLEIERSLVAAERGAVYGGPSYMPGYAQDYAVVPYGHRGGREVIEIDREPRREIVRIEKDRKGRMSLIKSTK